MEKKLFIDFLKCASHCKIVIYDEFASFVFRYSANRSITILFGVNMIIDSMVDYF